ncbi:Vitamin B12-binding protein [compost metagenome]
MGRQVEVNFPPKRIISLVPSQSELLFDLCLNEEVVGITKFCIHPVEKFASCTKVGGTKKLKIDVIRALQPDLIIGNKEENTRNDIELLMEEFPVWMSDIHDLDEAMVAIGMIGELVDRSPEAAYINHLIAAGFTDLGRLSVQKNKPLRVAYVIWKSPYLFAGRNTFIDDIIRRIGWTNIITENRYPELDPEVLKARDCNVVCLSSEPYPFNELHIDEIQSVLPAAKVVLVDGEMFSWYGSRLVKAVQYLFQLQNEF